MAAGAFGVILSQAGGIRYVKHGVRASFVAPLAVAGAFAFGAVPASAGAGDGVGMAPVAPPNTTAICTTPVSVTGVLDQTAAAAGHPGQRWAAPGDVVEVDGTGFSQNRCSVLVTIGTVTTVPPASGNPTAGTTLTFAAPTFGQGSTQGLDGPVTVQLVDPQGNAATSNSNYHFLEQPSLALQETQPAESSNLTMSGFGLNAGGDPLSFAGLFNGCSDGSAVPEAVTVSADTSAAMPVPSTYCDGIVELGVTNPHYDSTPGATDDSPITLSTAVGAVDIPPLVSSASPTSVRPGADITVVGTGFGPEGTATIAGAAAPTTWTDHEVIVTAPAGAASGALVMQRAGDHASFSAGRIGVVPPPPPPPPPSTGGPPAVAPSVAPPAAPPAQFAAPAVAVPVGHVIAEAPVSAPVNPRDHLTIATATTQGQVGGDVGIVVTLVVEDTPLANAPVSLSLVSSPGSDARVRPATGSTDSNGRFHARLHLSRLAGDHLIVARSGEYSDEVHVVGEIAATGSSFKLPFGAINISGNPLVVWLSVACFALVLGGVVVNINVTRRFLWSNTGGRTLRWLRRRSAEGSAGG